MQAQPRIYCLSSFHYTPALSFSCHPGSDQASIHKAHCAVHSVHDQLGILSIIAFSISACVALPFPSPGNNDQLRCARTDMYHEVGSRRGAWGYITRSNGPPKPPASCAPPRPRPHAPVHNPASSTRTQLTKTTSLATPDFRPTHPYPHSVRTAFLPAHHTA